MRIRDKHLAWWASNCRPVAAVRVNAVFDVLFPVGLMLVAFMALMGVLLVTNSAEASGVSLAIAVNSVLVQKRNELTALQRDLENVFQEAGSDLDMSRVKRIGAEDVSAMNVKEKNARVGQLNLKLNLLVDECKRLADQSVSSRFNFPHHPGVGDYNDPGGGMTAGKSIGSLVTEHPGFARWAKSGKSGSWSEEFDIAPSALLNSFGTKTLFETGAGWAPFSPRTDIVVPKVTRPIQVTDILPLRRVGSAKVVYMEETTRTHNAAEKAEGAAYAESVFALTERSSDVQKITDSLPVTDEQLEDEAQASVYIDSRLSFGVRQRLDGQVITGNGTAPNLRGILNVSGIQTQAKGADPSFDALRKAATKVAVTGRAPATHALLHPTDLETLDLTRTADGQYILRMPGQPGAAGKIWDLIPVQCDSLTQGTAIVGSFIEPFVTLWERKGVTIEVGYVGDQFKEGKRTIRATGRWAFVVARAAAFCTVTGL